MKYSQTQTTWISPPRLMLPAKPVVTSYENIPMPAMPSMALPSSLPYVPEGEGLIPPPPPPMVRPSKWLLWVVEGTYLLIALELAYIVYWLLAKQTVYQIVAWIILAILWAHIAAMTALSVQKRERKIQEEDVQLPSLVDHPALSQDTNMYLKSLRKELMEDAPTLQTDCVYPPVSHYDGTHRLIVSSHPAPTR